MTNRIFKLDQSEVDLIGGGQLGSAIAFYAVVKGLEKGVLEDLCRKRKSFWCAVSQINSILKIMATSAVIGVLGNKVMHMVQQVEGPDQG